MARDIRVENKPLTWLRPNPRNARKHPHASIVAIQKSIERFGFLNPIIARPDGEIIAGEGRFKAALKLGIATVPVVMVDMLDAEALAYLVVDNATTDLSKWDIPGLEEIARELAETDFDLRELGKFDFLDEIEWGTPGAGASPAAPEPPSQAAEELQKKWGTADGQLWVCGKHRVVCGSCTSPTVVGRLMQGEQADLCLTDPPYGVNLAYDQYQDTEEALEVLVRDFLPIARMVAKVCLITPGNKNPSIYPRADWILAWFCPAGIGRGPWGFTCWQLILAYGADPFLAHGMGSRPDALVLQEGASSKLHPVAKPLNVWKWVLERGSIERGQVVYDPFLGSGTTLVVCEELGRQCRGIELSPAYVAVSLERWYQQTGIQPTLEEEPNGEADQA